MQVNKDEICDLENLKLQTPDWNQYTKALDAKNEVSSFNIFISHDKVLL